MAKDPLHGILVPSARRVRAKLNGEIIADSSKTLLLRESGYELNYYFPQEDVRMDLLEDVGHRESSGYRGESHFSNVKVGDHVAENAAWHYPETKESRPDVRGYVAFNWKAMDAWYEEDEEIFVHPRDPFHRVDTIKSSRHIKVVVDGVTVAESNRPILLFETGLPTRYYIPQEDVNMDLLKPTDTNTSCPYKGVASYWSVQAGDEPRKDIVWGYPDPIEEIPKIKDLVAFYNEKVDIYIDGELEERPKTHWS